ncbi:acyl-CoA carboxylase subunit beta [Anaeromicropila populeti]|uniref:Acetyl-CoA carboxylase, carboxyltransferase component n=1 Tax=Anaeromicropila populeti TaxID=37658 RepID=A0A1I6IQG6_9FIRM|nr:acyl-CoA carboxylase subunit beta [Anaeromicropila populeti]SFR68982.1 Acetyl-CoA carboxylase, carboxyltransferase component [Anaeromicropila populeti]
MNVNYNYEAQHSKGKLHAIERIALLLDKDSFCEIGSGISNYGSCDSSAKKLPYDGVITGHGTIEGKTVFVYSQDFTVNGGSLGLRHGRKIAHVIELAIKNKCPIIGINDSGGARIQEGVNALAGYGDIFYYNTMASGYIPQISIIAGACAGGAVYSPGITDFIFVIDNISKMFVTGPNVVKSVTGQVCTAEELGGAEVHAKKSGVAHFYHQSERECFKKVRELVKIFPEDSVYPDKFSVYVKKRGSKIANIIPEESKKAYDVRHIIDEIVDQNSFLEVQEHFAQNVVIGFGKIGDITVGIVANQPYFMSGVLDCDSSDKAARFIRFCDSFDIPIISLVDVPGFMPSTTQEHSGIIRHGAKLLYAYAEATTTKLTVVLRKAYGGAYIAMCSKHLKADFVYAWPKAEIAVMGAEGAVQIINRKEMKALSGDDKKKFYDEKVRAYNDNFMNANTAVEEGYVDELIQPSETRERLYCDLVRLRNKEEMKIKKKHGNIPL